MKRAVILIAAAAVLASSGVASAHHAANVMYDLSTLDVMKAELKRVDWVNPHARFHFYKVDDAGKRTGQEWTFESGGPAAMRRLGMSGAGMMKVGDVFTVSYRPARDGTNNGILSILEFPDGRKLSQLPAN